MFSHLEERSRKVSMRFMRAAILYLQYGQSAQQQAEQIWLQDCLRYLWSTLQWWLRHDSLIRTFVLRMFEINTVLVVSDIAYGLLIHTFPSVSRKLPSNSFDVRGFSCGTYRTRFLGPTPAFRGRGNV